MPVRSSSTDAYCPVTPTSWRTRCGSRATSTPNTRACPASIGSSVASMCSSVVFPAPFGPRTPKISPWRTSRSMPSTARSFPECFDQPTGINAGYSRHLLLPSQTGLTTATLGAPGFAAPTSQFHGPVHAYPAASDLRFTAAAGNSNFSERTVVRAPRSSDGAGWLRISYIQYKCNEMFLAQSLRQSVNRWKIAGHGADWYQSTRANRSFRRKRSWPPGFPLHKGHTAEAGRVGLFSPGGMRAVVALDR